jgi:hypothetical protein
MTQCPICRRLHRGVYLMCEECQKESYTQQDVKHHPDCPKAWHPGGQCRCELIRGSRYE